MRNETMPFVAGNSEAQTMTTSRYPPLYQINTRVWLTELSRTLGKRATLDDIPDTERWTVSGFG